MAFLHPKLLRSVLGAGLFGLALTAGSAQAENIDGAGASFPYPLYAKWADAYRAATGLQVNYQSIGSGGGIKQISNKTVDFGASDAPMAPEELEERGLMQFPTVMGGIVPVINVPGVESGELKLTGELLAKIYLGEVKQWDDPAVKEVNPDLDLPDTKITPVGRSDGSGTTFIFTHYLSKVSPEWKERVGNATSVKWAAGVGGKGNEGVASYVKRIRGGIGYVEYAYALQSNISYAKLQNSAGRFVEPSSETFQAAAANADWEGTPGFAVLLTNQPGEKSWPITGGTFILVYKEQQDVDTARNVLKFFDWAYHNGDQMADELHYVPMPDNVVTAVENAWKTQLRTAQGEPVWTEALVQK